MKTHIIDQERIRSNFESYARSFDEIYGPPEKNLYLLIRWTNGSEKPYFLDLEKSSKT